MDGENSLDCFYFNDDLVSYDQINLVSAIEWKAFVDDRHSLLKSSSMR